MKKFNLPYLEFMVMRNCNLSCAGCTTYSDYVHTERYPTVDQILHDLNLWSSRINYDHLGTMGGEPLLHPHIEDILTEIRKQFPNTTIRFVTNGLLLDRHKKLIDKMHDLGNVIFKISKHVDDQRINDIINYIMTRFNWKAVTEYHINRWLTSNQFRFQINAPEKFYRTFRGTYFDMQPHHNNPDDAFDMCVQKTCPLLYNQKLFKCGTLPLTQDMLEKKNQAHKLEWQPYLNKGLDINCSDKDLEKWINNFGKPNAVCRQCPTKNDKQSVIDHRKNVIFK